jgi:hypothetical protein
MFAQSANSHGALIDPFDERRRRRDLIEYVVVDIY